MIIISKSSEGNDMETKVDLIEARNIINKIDKEMAALFEKRMDAVKNVALYKLNNNYPIYDSAREARVIEQNLKYISNLEYREFYKVFINDIMNISKDYQNIIINNQEE